MNKRKTTSIMLITIMLLQTIMPIESIYAAIHSDKFTIEPGYIKAVQAGSTVRYLRQHIQAEDEIIVKKDNAEQQEAAILATGMEAHIGQNIYTIIVKGDVNSDGEVTSTDLSKIRKHLSYKEELFGDEKYAVDINQDGKISSTDLSQMRKLLAYKLDVTPPTKVEVELVDYVQDTWTNKTVIQIFKSTDDDSGIARYETYNFEQEESTWVEEENPSEITQEGIYRKKARAIDREGNIGDTSEEYIVKIDKTAPEINVEIEKTIASITVKVEGQDALSGIKEYTYSIDDGQNWSEKETTENYYTFENLTHNTEYEIKVKATDNAGNESVTETQNITTIRIPGGSDIEFVQTPEVPINQNVEVTVIWPEMEEDYKKKYSLDGENWQDYTGPIEIEENTKIYVKVETPDGQSGEIAEYEITNIDKEEIKLTITGPDKEYIRQGEIATFTVESNKEITIKDIEKIQVEGCTIEVEGSGKSHTIKVTGGNTTQQTKLVIQTGAFTDIAGNENQETTKAGLAVLNEELILEGEETVYVEIGTEYIEPGYRLENDGGLLQVEVTPESIGTNTLEDKTITYNVKYKDQIIQSKTRTVKITDMDINITEITLDISDENNNTAQIEISGQNYGEIIYTSEDEQIATVDETGLIQAIANGTTTIKVRETNTGIERECIVTVQTSPTEVIISGNKNVGENKTTQLTATILPETANVYTTVTWTIEDEQVATIDADTGEVTGKAVGQTTITVTTQNNVTNTYTIEVTSIAVSPTSKTIYVNGEDTVELTATGSNPGTVSWESSDITVAKVNQTTGNKITVTGLKSGTVTITATGANGLPTATSEITVYTNPSGITIDGGEIVYVAKGNVVPITATIQPETADRNTGKEWTSSNQTVATINKKTGELTAKTTGQTTITVETENGKRDTQKVIVTDLIINPTSKILYVNGEDTVELTATGNNPGTISWESSDITVAKVNQTTGNSIKVTGISSGTAIITATGANGDTTATSIITVYASPSEVTIDGGETVYIAKGKTSTLTATIVPANADTNNTITWTSSNQTVATINSKTGILTAKEAGITFITVQTENGQTDTQRIIVTDLTINPTSKILYVNGENTATLTAVGNSPGTISWVSSDATVASVSATTGNSIKVTGLKNGTAIITATGANGGITATSIITVYTSPTRITLDKTTAEIDINEQNTVNLTATITPTNTDANNELTWESNNPLVARVLQTTGNSITVEAVSSGIATITVRTENGKTATCDITVNESPTGITIAGGETVYISKGKTSTLTATIQAATANKNTGKEWTSSNQIVATIDETTGVLTAKEAGLTFITVRTENGKIDTQRIIVTDLTIEPTSKILYINGENTATLTAAGNNPGTISWSSSNTSVATVNKTTGNTIIVTGKASGTAIITATGTNGQPTATCTITVYTNPSGLSLDKTDVTLDLNVTKTTQITATITPTNTDINNEVTWESDDSNIVRVLQTTGNRITIEAVSSGETIITARTGNGRRATCIVRVQTDPSSVTLNQTTATLDLNGTKTLELTATIVPANADSNTDLTWTTSNGTVASISATTGNNIKVTGLKNGTATITVRTGNGKTATCTVKVQTSPTGVTINGGETVYVAKGKTTTLTATIVPTTADTNNTITWTSSTPAVAEINSSTGVLTAKVVGETTITARTGNGQTDTQRIIVTDLTVSPTSKTLYVNGENTVTLTATGSNAGTITWTSNNTTVATVSPSTGNTVTVTGKTSGTATITAKGSQGEPTATCVITVKTNPSGVTVSPNTATLDLSGTKTVQLTATINPANADANTGLTWTSNATSIATVDNTGKVTGLKNGTATITVTTANGKTATCTVKVQTSPTGITINGNTYVGVGKTTTYTVTYTPTTADVNKTITWSSSTTANATINSSSGVITGVKAGTSTITARTANGITATKPITVTSVSVNPTSKTLDLSGTKTVTLTATGSNAGTISWTSSNASVATVSPTTGNTVTVTGLKVGTTTITATGSQGGPTATCVITVEENISKITIDGGETVYVAKGNTKTLTATVEPATANQSAPRTWASGTPAVATINSSTGLLTAKTTGQTTITVSTGNNKTDTQKVIVTDLTGGTTHYIKQGGTVTLTPTSSNAGTISWTTSNGVNAKLSNTTGTSTTVTGGATSGTYTVTATGSQGGPTTSYTIIVDTIAPRTPTATVFPTANTYGWYVSPTITVTITPVTDTGGSGIAGIKYRVNGGGWVTSTGTDDTTVSITTEGTNTIEYYAYDNVGNQSSTGTTIVKKDSVGPNTFTPTITNASSTGFTINASTTDATSGIYQYKYYVGGSLYTTSTSTSCTVTGLSSSTSYSVYVIAVDYAGNQRVSNSVTATTSASYTTFSKVSAGYWHGLGIDTSGNLWAWGRNTDGQLGNGKTNSSGQSTPVQVKAGTKFKEISAGDFYCLAIDENDYLWAWGNNEYGQLGNGNTTDQYTPVPIKSGTKFSKIAAGWTFSLALDMNGNIWSWGSFEGTLDGTILGSNENIVTVPKQITTGTKFKEIAAHGSSTWTAFAFAIDTSGNLWGWGSYGMLCEEYTEDQLTPVRLLSGKYFNKISVGSQHVMTLDTSGNLWGWGVSSYGQVGSGMIGSGPYVDYVEEIPVQIAIGTKFKDISTGSFHSIAIDQNNNVWGWGENYGVTGQFSGGDIANPIQITSGKTINQISGGYHFSLAVDSSGYLWAWGQNDYAQLGNGDRNISE